MPKSREQIPKAVRDGVLREFNHRCAVCGKDRPHLHHIDEDPANNDPQNLMPLCPNCHLVDQHDASNAMPQPKLHLFRRYKHRHILKPQFNPVLRRLAFLRAINDSDDPDSLQEKSTELIELVRNLAMGQFYAESLKKLLNRPINPYAWIPGDPISDARMAARMEREALEYRDQLRRVNVEVEALIVEMLDYQTWT